MDDYPDEALLSTGVAFHTGGCDKTGHPLVIYPTEHQGALTATPASDIVQLLNYFKLIVPVEQRLNGFTYLINLQSANQKTITQLVTSLNTFQLSADGLVHCLYVIRPKASKNVKLLEKLTGLKTSKKNPIRNLYQVHILKDFASLHRSVDKISLTEEFGGHQQFNISAWVQFRLQVDSVTVEISRCQNLLEESRDQMHILCELEMPTSIEQTQPLLDTISSRYTAIMGNLNLEHVIDNCASILEELNSSKVQMKHAQGDLLRYLVKHIRTSQRELTEAREQLQVQWKQALARIVQASQLKVHQKNANKINKWIDRNGKALLSKLSQPITSLQQVSSLLEKSRKLSTDLEELQKEADYIQTDVEYMTLHDISEFTQSLQAIESMKAELDKFNTSLAEADERLNTASSLFTNVAKCYSWYADFLTSLPRVTDAADFLPTCVQCLEGVKDRAPPIEWLGYIESKLKSVDDEQYRENTSILIKRIHRIYGVTSETEDRLILQVVNRWIAALDAGFNGLTKSLTPVQPTAKFVTGKKSLHSSRKSSAPKLRGASRAPDSSTDDVEQADAMPVRAKRPTKSRRSPSSKDAHNSSKESAPQEAYIDLTDVSRISQLPHSLSHVDMEKFLEHEPRDSVLASSTPVDGVEQGPRLEHSTESTIKLQHKHKKKEKKVPGSTDTSTTSRAVLSKSTRRKKKYRVRQDDDTDDSCPTPSDYLSTTGSALLSVSSLSCAQDSADVPQNYHLPYNPITHKERLEHIYRSSSPTLEQKLDMMVSLIEEGDESCFYVRSPDYNEVDTVKRRSPIRTQEKEKQLGRLTPANISRELSADVTYPEHIYHWLRKQNDENFISREHPTDVADVADVADDTASLKDCIERAEKILEEGMPVFNHTYSRPLQSAGYLVDPMVRGSNDGISKSGDSGITELTARDTLLFNNHQRYASKESGLESDITGYTATSSEPYHRREVSTRPRPVPPLWLNKSYNRASRSPSHHLRASRLREQTASGTT